MSTSLSVIIITKNASQHIQRCLESIAWANEIIVVDSGSTDDTVQICKKFTDQVYYHDWPGFGPQKNKALSYAAGDWVLSLDADEVVTPKLKQHITATLQNPIHEVYHIRRHSFFLGKLIKHGDWRHDTVARLFKRGSAQFSNDQLHEKLVFDHKAGLLSHPILHYSYETVDDVLDKLHRYAICGAQQRFNEGKTASFGKAIGKALWTFFRGYILRLGFLDGKYGWMLALYNMHYTYYRYLALWQFKQ